MENINSESPFLLKARKYCDFQERCHSEVRAKLKEWKVEKKEAEEIVSALITEGYLNEERYARAFARGKFRIKKWGRKKIVAGLKMKGVTDYCIRMGLKEIGEKEYRDTMEKMISKKMNLRATLSDVQKAGKYAISRGFEPEQVWGFLNAR